MWYVMLFYLYPIISLMEDYRKTYISVKMGSLNKKTIDKGFKFEEKGKIFSLSENKGTCLFCYGFRACSLMDIASGFGSED